MNRRSFLLSSLTLPILLCAKHLSPPWNLGKYGDFSFKKMHANIFLMQGVMATENRENQGFINNPAFIESNNGLILIDPGGSYEVGKEVLKQIQVQSSKPVIAIFNTHCHDDHWFANAAIKEVYPKLKIYAHVNMPKAASELYGGTYAYRRFTFKKAKKVLFADTLLKHNDTLTIDGQNFSILHPKSAHTNNDIAIIHHNSNTIFMGDLLLCKTLANFGLHSSIRGNIRFLEEIIQKKEFTLYVAGHGPSGGKKEALLPYYTYLKIIEEEVEKAYEQELSIFALDEVKEIILQRFSWEEGLDFPYAFVERYMQHIYTELEAQEQGF